jgi:hypothetical protein
LQLNGSVSGRVAVRKIDLLAGEENHEIKIRRSSPTSPSLALHSFSKMQAPVIVMNDASARQTGRKAQTSNITAAKVKPSLLPLPRTVAIFPLSSFFFAP